MLQSDWLQAIGQNLAANALWYLGGLAYAIVMTVLKRKHSAWFIPALYGLIAGVLVMIVAVTGTVGSKWPRGGPVILVGIVIVITLVHFLLGRAERESALVTQPSTDHISPAPVVSESARLIELRDDLDVMRRERNTAQAYLETCQGEHEQALIKLNECESNLKHWKDEVGRVDLQRRNEKRTIEEQWHNEKRRGDDLAQKLTAAQDKLQGFESPRARLKIKRAEYTLLGKEGLDVTETLERMILDETLRIDFIYNDVFRPDPWKRSPKHLTIEFSHGPQDFAVTVPENTAFTLPFPYRGKKASF